MKDTNKSQTGALLLFKPGVTREQARRALEALKNLLESQQVNTFNPDWGNPVWYIP